MESSSSVVNVVTKTVESVNPVSSLVSVVAKPVSSVSSVSSVARHAMGPVSATKAIKMPYPQPPLVDRNVPVSGCVNRALLMMDIMPIKPVIDYKGDPIPFIVQGCPGTFFKFPEGGEHAKPCSFEDVWTIYRVNHFSILCCNSYKI